MTVHNHQHDVSSDRISVVFFLNFSFTIIELIGGVLTTIGLAWLLSKLSRKHPNNDFTYGYYRFSLLGALVNGVVLVVGSIWVLSESLPKLLDPEMPHAQGMFWLAILGVAVNGFAAWKLSKGKTLNERILNWHLMEDVLGWISVLIVSLNERILNWHLMEDVLGWISVLIVSILLIFFDWPILDPILSIAFTLFILMNVLKNTSNTIKIFLQSAPDNKMLDNIRNKLNTLDHVNAIHYLHLWSLDGERHVLTAHLEIDHMISANEQKQIKQEISKRLADFSLAHTTIEFELPEESCRDD